MESLDPTIIALTKAIGHQESGGDYNKVGDNGHSMGAYQWNNPTKLSKGQIPKNFGGYASEVGVNPNDFSPANQDRVAYKTIEKWGKQGLTPAQIASKWNSGSPDDYKTAKPGYNSAQGVNYDVKGYVDNVAKYYEHYNSSNPTSDYNPTPYSNPSTPEEAVVQNTPTNQPEKQEGLGSQLNKRLTDASTALSETASQKINPLSGILQTVGAGAGAIGDVTGAVLDLIPGVKQAEGLIGKGVGKLAETNAGKSVSKGIANFQEQHPEISKDIGAVGNIATAIPILKGVGLAKNVIKKGVEGVLGKSIEKTAAKNIGEVAARTIKGRTVLSENPEAIKILAKKEYAPVLEEGRFTTNAIEDSHTRLDNAISDIDKKELQPLLKSVSTTNVADRMPLGELVNGKPTPGSILEGVMSNARKELQDSTPILKQFELIKNKYGDYLSLEDLNNAKRDIARKIKDTAFGTPDYSPLKNIRTAFQKSVEANAKRMGLGDVYAINQKMSRLYKAQDLLDAIREKAIKPSKFKQLKKGLIKKVVGGAATAVGAKGAYDLYNNVFGD